jgi:hypothetical protein
MKLYVILFCVCILQAQDLTNGHRWHVNNINPNNCKTLITASDTEYSNYVFAGITNDNRVINNINFDPAQG